VIRPIEGGIRTVAHQLEEIDPPREQYPLRIHGILAAWPDVYGSTIAVEVNESDARSRPFAPYYFRRSGAIAYSDLALDSYAYRDLPWYRRAADTRQPAWSQPYFDAGGGDTWMVTYSVPFFRRLPAGQRVLAGVVTADLDLGWVRAAAEHVSLGPVGVGWLASAPATPAFIAPIGDTPRRVLGFGDPGFDAKLRVIAERMLTERVSFKLVRTGVGHEPNYVVVRKLETLGWRLMLAIPKSQLLAQARRLLERQLWLGAAGLALLVTAISFVAAGVSRPIHALATTVGGAEEGSLDFHLPEIATRDETGVLTAALRRLRDSLKRHVELRASTLAAQARLDHELQIAASIQQSMLPRGAAADVPPGARIAATLVPAKQVGGDFYDYFARRDGSLLFAVGDVSDKGIPAALFMARLSGLLRVLGHAGGPPDQLLAQINSRLADGNDACMFATIGCGVLALDTGHLRYASAGHDPPLMRRMGGSIAPLATENGPAVGIDAPVEYRVTEAFMAPGDTLVLYTDGVTEAEAADGTQFSVERLAAIIGGDAPADAAQIVQRISGAVAAAPANFRATDDLTVLAVSPCPDSVTTRRDGRAEVWRIEPAASSAGVRQAQQCVRAILAARAVPPGCIGDAELIVEELLTNIVRGNAAQAGGVRIVVECGLDPQQVVLSFRDDGRPFDPLAHAGPSLDADISDRDIGGLGIHLVRRLASQADYSFKDGHNQLVVHLPYTAAQPGATP
jgi:sigma-B regulation protein RsbU (phosphoserine phosphatase)